MKSKIVSFLTRKLSLSGSGKMLSPAVAVAVAAVALSYIVMLASISIVDGFKREIRDKVTGFNSHITLMPGENSDGTIRYSPALRQSLEEIPYIKDVSPELAAPAVFKTSNEFKGIYLKGISSSHDLDFIAGKSLVAGSKPDFNNEKDRNTLLISDLAAKELSVSPGDSLLTYIITDNIRVRKMPVAGVFNTRFENYDKVFAYTSLDFIRETINSGIEDVTAIRLLTSSFDSVDNFSRRIGTDILSRPASAGRLPEMKVDTVLAQGGSFFQWLALLDTNVAVILCLMGIVTVVTMISALLIVITDNVYLVGLLKALGAGNSLIRRVFIRLAMKITMYGLIAGNIIIIPILWLQDKYRFIPLDPDSYYIDFVPVALNSVPIILLNAGVLLLVWAMMLLPSSYIMKIRPSETLKYD